MILERIEVKRFRRVRDADLTLAAGLNVIHGPNDLGKSTLAEAVRAALLLRSTSKEAERFVPWDDLEAQPMVRLTFRDPEGTRWRVRKRFGRSGGAGALLERELGGEWETVAKGRHADGELRELLRWGVPGPGGRGGPRGVPDTFLARALLGAQGKSTALFEASVAADPSSSGREWLEETVASYARDEAFDRVLERARAEVARAYLPNGKRSAAAGSPFRLAADRVQARLEAERAARAALEAAESAQGELAEAREALVAAERARLEATRRSKRAEARAHRQALATVDAAIAEAEAEEATRAARAAQRAEALAERERALERLTALRAEESELEGRLAGAQWRRAAGALASARKRRAETEARARAARARARLVEQAACVAEERALQAKRDALRARADEVRDLRERAAAREAEAATIAPEDGPDPAVVRAAVQALEVARARVSVGLRLGLELGGDVDVEVSLDDGPARFEPGRPLAAASRARVALSRRGEHLATLEVEAGDDADHVALVEARRALAALLSGLLEGAEEASLDALLSAAEAFETRRAQADERRAEAGRLREAARERSVDGALDEVEAALASVAERIAARAEATEALDEAESVEALSAAASEALAEAEEALRAAEDAVVRAEATAEAGSAALPEGALPGAAGAEPSAPDENDPEALSRALTAVRKALGEAEAAARVAVAPETEDDARSRLAELRARRAALIEAAPPTIDDDEGSDETLPDPAEAADELAAAEAAVRSAREAIARLEGRADRQPLAAARARLDEARAATERARAAEREVELEYEGYRRLVASLEATAAHRGRDLGAALVGPVSARFAALLEAVGGDAERYGSLVLDRDASTEGAVVDGELRDLEALSMGTREQLAMLLRLTLAERLGSFLLLDDHLTHTDAARAAAIGELYREVAERTQLIVFTCHPGRYLGAGGGDHVHAIDAERLLRGDGATDA